MFKYSYFYLWNFLKESGKLKIDLLTDVGISSSTLAKMNKNERVSSNVIKRISQKYGIDENLICEFKSDFNIWLESIRDKIICDYYTIYLEKWPEVCFTLTNEQKSLFEEFEEKNKIKSLIKGCESIVNFENRISGKIIDSTTCKLQGNKLILSGSDAVIEKIITNLFL